jgi:hypothetical protein
MSPHPIKPPPYKPTDQEHQIAYLKWCLERIVWDELLSIDMARRDPSITDIDPDDPRHWETRFQYLLDKLFRPGEDGVPRGRPLLLSFYCVLAL